MELTPPEKDKRLIFTAAVLAERRMAPGVKLNYPEAIAYLAPPSSKGRDGGTVAELMSHGARLLTRDDVMEGCARDGRRDPGRGDLFRRHQAGHRAPPHHLRRRP